MKTNPLNFLKIGIFVIFLLLVLTIFHLIVGFLGIQYFSGTLISILILLLCIFFKFTLPITIGTFLGIIYVLEWHWIFALLITLPGLIFVTPKRFAKTFNFTTFQSGFNFEQNGFKFSNRRQTVKTNVKNVDVIDGEYKIINENKNKK